jgi:hypothetical protein
MRAGQPTTLRGKIPELNEAVMMDLATPTKLPLVS